MRPPVQPRVVDSFLTDEGSIDDDVLDAWTVQRNDRWRCRLCLACGKALAVGARSDARYCREACRRADTRFWQALKRELFDVIDGQSRTFDLANAKPHRLIKAPAGDCTITRAGADEAARRACLQHLMTTTEARGSVAECPAGRMACPSLSMRGGDSELGRKPLHGLARERATRLGLASTSS